MVTVAGRLWRANKLYPYTTGVITHHMHGRTAAQLLWRKLYLDPGCQQPVMKRLQPLFTSHPERQVMKTDMMHTSGNRPLVIHCECFSR